ncbi:MAG: sensor domain-containing diguanylate cyclase, partial [Hylemonella sp.]
LLCLWGCVGFWSWWERSSTLAANEQVLKQLNTAVHEQTRNLFKEAQTSLTVASLWMAEHPDQDPGKASGFIRLVENLRKSSDDLIDIRMVTRDGTLRYVPDRGQTNRTNVADRDYFQAQFEERTRGLYVAKPVVSRVTGKLGIPISIPVSKAGGDIAVIFAAIELDRIAGNFEAERIQPRGTIAILRDDGLFMFRSPMDDKIIGSSVAQSAMWQRNLGALPRGFYESERSPVDGLSRAVAYTRVQDYPLVVAVTASLDDLLRAWRMHTLILVSIALLISIACLLLAATLLRCMRDEATVRRTLEHLMLTDPLTGVGNRRMLELRLDDEILRAERYRRALTVVYFDLDHFKQVNDKYGHDVGDTVLRQVADSLVANLRQSDHVARMGGEEFVTLLTETGLDDAVTLVERMRAAVAALQIPGLPQHITISAGLAQWREGENAETLLRRADQALYRAKASGRNSAFTDLQA